MVVRDVVPTSDRWNGYGEKVVLRKPEGLAEVREGTEVEVGVDVVHSVDEDGEGEGVDVRVKSEGSEGEYVQVGGRDKESEESGKGRGERSHF